MKNKLGLTEYYFDDIEKNLIKFKMRLLDDKFTFNCDFFSFEYLKRLHEFLFEDLYNDNFSGARTLNKIEVDYINQYLTEVKKLLTIRPLDIDYILLIIEKIWHFQPFIVGNTRTMFSYLKILNQKFLLGLNVNEEIEIKSTDDMFKVKKYVNQK